MMSFAELLYTEVVAAVAAGVAVALGTSKELPYVDGAELAAA
jgi:hypothetical protein